MRLHFSSNTVDTMLPPRGNIGYFAGLSALYNEYKLNFVSI